MHILTRQPALKTVFILLKIPEMHSGKCRIQCFRSTTCINNWKSRCLCCLNVYLRFYLFICLMWAPRFSAFSACCLTSKATNHHHVFFCCFFLSHPPQSRSQAGLLMGSGSAHNVQDSGVWGESAGLNSDPCTCCRDEPKQADRSRVYTQLSFFLAGSCHSVGTEQSLCLIWERTFISTLSSCILFHLSWQRSVCDINLQMHKWSHLQRSWKQFSSSSFFF